MLVLPSTMRHIQNMNPKIAESWQELADFIVFRNSIDLGALSRLNDAFLSQTNQDAQSFSDQIATFLSAVSSQAKTQPKGEADLLAILSIDSLISNLYGHTKNGEPFQPNSSSFYGWMSSSQMSVDHSLISERQAQLIPQMIAALAGNEAFFKRLKSSMEKSRNHEQSKRSVQALLDTLDSILGKEKISRQNFNKLRGKHIGLQRGKKDDIFFPGINKVIFSSELNKVVGVLTQGSDYVHLALLRIYLNWSEESKMYEGCKFNGDEMLANLYRYYISCFREVQDLFEEGKHPLFRLIRNHLALFFTPVLRKFHQLVVKIGSRYGSQSGFSFYKASATYLEAQFSQFINEMPNELLKFISQLKDLVQEQYPGQSNEALAAVKKMFFYSFLLNQSLIQELYPRHDPSKWSQTYNHVLNLFFQSSIKKYTHLSEGQQEIISRLVQKIAGNLDDRIVHQYARLETEELVSFKVRDNILNHDFGVIKSTLSNLEFTPKDSKQFEMKKICNIAPESPVYRHFKTQQGFKTEEVQEELEMATWMSVGGSHDYSFPQNKSSRRNLTERLEGLKTIDAKTRSKLQGQSQSFLQYFNNW